MSIFQKILSFFLRPKLFFFWKSFSHQSDANISTDFDSFLVPKHFFLSENLFHISKADAVISTNFELFWRPKQLFFLKIFFAVPFFCCHNLFSYNSKFFFPDDLSTDFELSRRPKQFFFWKSFSQQSRCQDFNRLWAFVGSQNIIPFWKFSLH